MLLSHQTKDTIMKKNKPKTKQDFERWITEQIAFYKPILGLELQKILVEEVGGDHYLQCKLTYPYLDPTVGYTNLAFLDFQKNAIDKDRILHELCHAITDPLYVKSTSRYVSKNEIEDERERLTDTFAAIIRKLT